jgi:hypothetical protein
MDSFAHFADFFGSFAVKSSVLAAAESYLPATSAAATAARTSGAEDGVTEDAGFSAGVAGTETLGCWI